MTLQKFLWAAVLFLITSCIHISSRPSGEWRIEEASIADLQAAMASGALSSRALVEHYLERIEHYDKAGPRLNAFLYLNPRVREEADQLDRERAQGHVRSPLHGIPIALKDNMNTKDMPTTGGSTAFQGAQPHEDAFVVAKLRAAGAVFLGKTNLHELARAGTTVSSLGGQTLNPYDLSRTPGGSSGGTAVAVAANLAAAGMGSDTVNSIRSPASACDLVGLRPTRGLVSRSGVIPAALTQDMVGPITRWVEDAGLILEIIQGPDPKDPTTAEAAEKARPHYPLRTGALQGARLGVLRSFFGTKPEHAEVNEVMSRALQQLKAHGAELVELDAPLDVDKLIATMDVQKWESRTQIDAWLSDLGPGAPAIHTFDAWVASGKYDQTIAKGLKDAQPFDHPENDPEYRERIGPRRDALKAQVAEIFAQNRLDAIIYPHQKRLAVPVGQSQTDRNGFLASITGHPAIDVPAGFAKSGMPVGMEFFGMPYSEGRLLELAYSWEEAVPNRHPPPSAP